MKQDPASRPPQYPRRRQIAALLVLGVSAAVGAPTIKRAIHPGPSIADVLVRNDFSLGLPATVIVLQKEDCLADQRLISYWNDMHATGASVQAYVLGAEDVADFADSLSIGFPVAGMPVRDGVAIARQLGATQTPIVFDVDAEGWSGH